MVDMMDLNNKSCIDLIKLFKDKVGYLGNLILNDTILSEEELYEFNNTVESILKLICKKLKSKAYESFIDDEEPSEIYNSFIEKTLEELIPSCYGSIKMNYECAIKTCQNNDSDNTILNEILNQMNLVIDKLNERLNKTLESLGLLTFSGANLILDLIYTTVLYINLISVILFSLQPESSHLIKFNYA